MKKHIYVICVIILWIMLSYVAHVIWLAKFGSWMLPQGPAWMRCNELPMWAQLSVIITGVIVGYSVGTRRWNIVYVEKRHWRDCMKSHKK